MAEAETVAVRGELKTALKRVEDLQSAISGELDSENSDNVSLRDHHRAGDDDKARYWNKTYKPKKSLKYEMNSF